MGNCFLILKRFFSPNCLEIDMTPHFNLWDWKSIEVGHKFIYDQLVWLLYETSLLLEKQV